ncbi:hypothetical protein [Tissierella praeacuta]|uniref:hypothetical protein n=1 Tax=Tissierella praeacuta TaxID=43131 RepID=UPI001C1039C0|nr:hypothetical protein [Tissierella praeacuta]MBU5256846.1 hypothetical protein [Tissierella praeacuta]
MIEIKAERVRKKARLDESYDIDIQDTIEEMMPFIESKIDEVYLNTDDISIQSIINLGATEIIVGEFIKEQSNDEEDSVSLGVGPIKIGENSSSKNRMSRAKDFLDSGWEKLKPYLKDEDPFYFGIM